MKRKLFTLLLAFVAIAAFQATAQTAQYWIKVDTTGINGQDPYYLNKGVGGTGYLNDGPIQNNKWLTYKSGFTVSPSTDDVEGIYKGKTANVFNVTKSSGVDGRFEIKALSGQQLTLPIPSSSEQATAFEVVQFNGGASGTERSIQQFGAGTHVAGYLTPTQGGVASKEPWELDLLLVGTTGQGGALTIKKLSNWGTYTTSNALLEDDGYVSYQNTSKTFLRNRIYLSQNGFDILDAKGKWIIGDSIFGGAPDYEIINEETEASAATNPAGYNYAYLDLYGNTQGKFWKNPIYGPTGATDTLDIATYVGANSNGILQAYTAANPAGLQNVWGHFYLKLESNGSLSLTFQHGNWANNTRTWSNGDPTRFAGGVYYFFNLNVGGVPSSASAINVATAQGSLQGSQLFADLFTGYGSAPKFIYKDNNNGWQPLWVEIDPICADPQVFITPEWLASNKLLSLPLSNQVWSAGAPATAWISIGAGDATSKDAIVANTAPTDASDELTHTYANTIIGGVLTLEDGNYNLFGSQVDVDLYYVQNKEGYYLTVVDNGLPRSTSALSGINGVQLKWVKEKYVYDADEEYNKTVFQLFAVSGYKIKESDPYGEFSYYPLASYTWDYVTGKIVWDRVADPDNDIVGIPQINYNTWLGYLTASTCLPSADLTGVFRIGYYSSIDSPVKELVVYASYTNGYGNITPIEVKLSHKNILKPISDYVYVQNNNAGANKNKFYTIDDLTNLDPTKISSAWDLTSHWKLAYDDADDTKVLTFDQELQRVYENTVGRGAGFDIPVTSLPNEYYALEYLAGSEEALAEGEGTLTVRLINLSGLTALNNWVAQYDTLTLYPATHDVPFLDLEAAAYNLAEKFAILEAPFVDRNLTDCVAGDATTPTPSYNPIQSYKTYIARVGEGYNETEFLTVYPVNERVLAPEHIVPYYVFSITKNSIEYFLNVKPASEGAPGAVDTVLWTTLTAANRERLLNWSTTSNIYLYPNYKFALPYQVNADSTLVAGIDYNGANRTPVYLQTFDVLSTDNPYLIISGAATKYVNVVRYNSAFKTAAPAWKIYSGDYSNINPEKVTSWIFGAQKPADQEWVPLLTSKDPDVIGSTTGVLTNQILGGGGVTFIAPSNAPASIAPVNYAALTGLATAPDLTFEFVGDTLIGNYTKKQIWYYRIKLGDTYLSDTIGNYPANVAGGFLYGLTGSTQYPYAFFSDVKEPDYAPYLDIKADRYFEQTFGFKAVGDNQDGESNFLIVSHANYRSATPVAGYRYLAEINNRLVFVTNANDALVFQFGKNKDGDYTDITVVGKSGIYGVEGGVKILNGTGKVDIYSIDGRLVKSTLVTGADQTIAAPKGIVIVKNGANVAKVVVK
jgi:hypothetical protein